MSITPESLYAEAEAMRAAEERAVKSVHEAMDLAIRLMYAAANAASVAKMAPERISAIRKIAYEAAQANKP